MPLIPADAAWLLLAIMVAGTTVALWLEGRYRWGAQLSAPVIALLIAMVLSNLPLKPLIPTKAPVYDFIPQWLVPIALPLLLFRADLFKIARSTGRMLVGLAIASLGTIIGAFLAIWIVGHHVLEPAKATAIMTGSYIGGMVNFLALKESTLATESLTTALIVADNLVMAALFVALLAISNSKWFQRQYPPSISAHGPAAETDPLRKPAPVTTMDVSVCLAIAVGIAGVGMSASQWLEVKWPVPTGGTWAMMMLQTLVTNKFVLITGLSLAVSTLFARPMAKFNGAEPIGGFLLYLFLFTVGLEADLKTVIAKSPILFVFCGIMAFTNLAVTLIVGKLCRLPLEELLLSSNATVGGPPTAAAMAMSKGWHGLVLPGVLAGLGGYIIGTPLGLMIYSLVR